MREILFRAKSHYLNEWLCGVVVHDDEWFISVSPLDAKNHIHCQRVKEDTIGQFTGLLDKNGQKIFEGDIFNLGDKDILYIVVWSDTGFRGRQTRSTSYVGLEYWKDRIKIIGNIHDNHELLEVK